MSRLDQLVRCSVGRVVPDGSALHDEIVDMAVERGRHRGGARRLTEALSAMALGLRLRSGLATGDDSRQIVAQGAAWAAPVVLALVGAWTWADLSHDDSSALGPIFAGVAFTAALVVVAARAERRPRARHVVASLVICLLAGAIGSVLVPDLVRTDTLVVASAVAPAFALALGWFDPRFAVLATAVWAWRFASIDLGALASGLESLAGELAVESIVVRWLAMAGGVLAGWLVTHQSIGRRQLL